MTGPTEEFRQRTIRLKLARMETNPCGPAIPTGFAALDETLAGGLPRGRIVEIFGPSSSGKTTLALQIVAHVQRAGGAAGWIDAEHAFDPAYAALLGVAGESLAVGLPDSAEQGLEMARRLADSGAVDLLVIDSAAALVPRLELETGLGEGSVGLQGRVLGSGLRTLSRTVARTGASLVFLNQTRTRKDSSGAESETSAGGVSLKLYASVRIALRTGAGRRLRFRILKNKVAAAFAEGALDWKEGIGFVETP